MPKPLQLPDGSVVVSNRFGNGPFDDFQHFVRVIFPQCVAFPAISARPEITELCSPHCYCRKVSMR
jgi:hypothetical protein